MAGHPDIVGGDSAVFTTRDEIATQTLASYDGTGGDGGAVERQRDAGRADDLDLPFPLERLRGVIVQCSVCGAPIAVFRRRRFYALRADAEETPEGGVLVCRVCGARQPVRELLTVNRRVRRS